MLTQRLQIKRNSYDIVTGETVLSAPTNKQILLQSLALVNGTNNSMDLAMGHTMNSYGAQFYTSVSGSVATVSGSTTIFTTTNNDGFYIQAKELFSMFTYNVTQAETGSPVYEFAYWNGSSFVTFTPKVTPDHSSTGIKAAIFYPHYKWVAGSGGITGLDSLQYTLRVRATTAPSTDVIADDFQVCKLITYREAVEGNQGLSASFGDQFHLLLEQGESLIPYFSTANAENTVEIAYRYSP